MSRFVLALLMPSLVHRLAAMVLLVASVSCQPGFAEIALHADFDSASLDLQRSKVEGDVVTLAGAATWTAHPDNYRWIYFRATGVEGKRPSFRLTSGYLGNPRGTNYFYSYDQVTWTEFEAGQLRPRDAFTQDEVFIAHSVPYPYSRTVDKMAEWTANEFVTTTASGNEQFSVGTVPNSTTRGPEQLELFGFRIANDRLPRDKKKILLAAGNHSGEVAGDWALEGMVDFILGDDPRAAVIRDNAELFVYPQIDPLGRIEGYFRGNSQNPMYDHNRLWNAPITGDSGGFTEIDILNEAWRIDTDGAVEMTFDFHGFWSRGPNFVITEPVGDSTQFMETLRELEPNVRTEDYPGIFGVYTLAPFGIRQARTTKAMNTRLQFTPELGLGNTLEDHLSFGQSLALSLLDELLVPACDWNHDGACDAGDLDPLQGLYQIRLDQELTSLSATRAFDLNRDDVVNQADLDYWLAEAGNHNGLPTAYRRGDANLDGQVDFRDFVALSVHFGSREAAWTTGDFNGDRRVTLGDFVAMSQNFGGGVSPTAVPEPSSTWLLLTAVAVTMWSIRGSGQAANRPA